MAEVIEMVQLSPTMEEGVVVAWLKNVGDKVAAGDIVAEVETDKATMEMESYFDGTLLAILVEPGDAAPVGTALAVVGEEGEDIEALLAELKDRRGAPAKSGTEQQPEPEGDADAGAEDEAEAAADGEAEAEAEDKAEAAPAKASPSRPPPARTAGSAAQGAPRRAGDRVLASPLARRLADERGYDLAAIPGTGPQGRVVRRDVEAYVPTAGAAPSMFQAPVLEERVEKLSQMRKAIARTLSSAWQAPVFMLTRDIAMERLVAVRDELNEALAEAETGQKLSFNDFVIKACARALLDVPAMNVAFEGDTIRYFGSADIGMAVAIEGGLITPIIRDAQLKSVGQISDEARDLGARARARKLQPEEFTGATFSVSNLGMYGIDHFTAVLNPPAAGILAVGRIRTIPVVGPDDALTVGQRMTVTLTCDHRAVDGAIGATFLQRFARYMEAPSVLLA